MTTDQPSGHAGRWWRRAWFRRYRGVSERVRSDLAMTDRRFAQVRGDALSEIAKVLFDGEGYSVPCNWQDAHGDDHVAAYCNLLSHIESLADFLSHASWCDDILLTSDFDDSASAESLFRYYTTAYLLIDQCFADCLDLLQTASDGRSDLSPESQRTKKFVNRVWKHRGSRGRGSGAPAFHTFNHHGPYFFDDVGHAFPVPVDGRYMSVDHWPAADCGGAVPVVVPNLTTTIRAIGGELAAITNLLNDVDARQKVTDAWGSTHLP